MISQEKKDVIAEAALSCFKLGGYGGTSMDDIVKKAGISKGGIYWHFKSKEEIFLYLLEKEAEHEKTAIDALQKKEGTVLNRLRIYVNWLVQYSINSPIHLLMAEFVTRIKRPDTMDKLRIIITKKNAGFQTVQEILHQGVKNGEFLDMDCQVMAELYWSICEGLVTRYFLFHRDSELLKKTFATAEDIFINNLCKEANN